MVYHLSFHDAQGDVEVVARSGETILEAALKNDIALRHDCGGTCTCTTCHIHINKGMEHIEAPSVREMHFLRRVDDAKAASRLACQCLLKKGQGLIEIRIPPPHKP